MALWVESGVVQAVTNGKEAFPEQQHAGALSRQGIKAPKRSNPSGVPGAHGRPS